MTKEENLHNLTEVITVNLDRLEAFSKMSQELQRSIVDITVSDAACLKGNKIKRLTARLMLIGNTKIYLNKKFIRISSVFKKVIFLYYILREFSILLFSDFSNKSIDKNSLFHLKLLKIL